MWPQLVHIEIIRDRVNVLAICERRILERIRLSALHELRGRTQDMLRDQVKKTRRSSLEYGKTCGHLIEIIACFGLTFVGLDSKYFSPESMNSTAATQ